MNDDVNPLKIPTSRGARADGGRDVGDATIHETPDEDPRGDERPPTPAYMQSCPECGGQCSAAANFCQWCGEGLRVPDDACPACGSEGELAGSLAGGQRYCPAPTVECGVVTFQAGEDHE